MKTKAFACLLLLPALVSCYPIFFLLVGSLMGSQELKECLGAVMGSSEGYLTWHFLPLYPTLRSYVELLLDSPEFFVMFWNSVKMTAGILLGQLLVGAPAAWAFAKYRFPFQKILFTGYILMMMLPFQVRMLSEYLVLDQLHLLDSQWGIILPGIFSTFSVFIMYRFFEGIPDALIEAAKLDGAGHLWIFVMIGVPLGSAGIISAMVLSFLEYWNLIEQPMAFLSNQQSWPLSLFLPQISMNQAAFAFTASVFTLLPALLVFLAGRDYLEQGIASVGVKE